MATHLIFMYGGIQTRGDANTSKVLLEEQLNGLCQLFIEGARAFCVVVYFLKLLKITELLAISAAHSNGQVSVTANKKIETHLKQMQRELLLTRCCWPNVMDLYPCVSSRMESRVLCLSPAIRAPQAPLCVKSYQSLL